MQFIIQGTELVLITNLCNFMNHFVNVKVLRDLEVSHVDISVQAT